MNVSQKFARRSPLFFPRDLIRPRPLFERYKRRFRANPAYVQDACNSAGGVTSVITTITAAGSGNMLVAWMRWGGTTSTPTVSDNGSPASTWKILGNPFYDSANSVTIAVFTASNVTGAPTQITASCSGASGGALQVVEISGAGSIDIASSPYGNGTGTSQTLLPVATLQGHGLILGFINYVGGYPSGLSVSDAGATSASWTLLSSNGGGSAGRIAGCYATTTANGTYAPKLSWSTSGLGFDYWTLAVSATATPFQFYGNQADVFSYPSSSSGQTEIFPYACTPGSLLLALVSAYTGTPGSTAVSDGTNGTWTYIGNTTGGYGNMSAYFIKNSASSALSVSWSGSLTFPGFQVVEIIPISGIPSSPLDASATNSGADTQSVAVNFASDLVVGFPLPNSGQTMNAGTGWNTTDGTNVGNSVGSTPVQSPIIWSVASAAASPLFNNSGGLVVASFKKSGGNSYTKSLSASMALFS